MITLTNIELDHPDVAMGLVQFSHAETVTQDAVFAALEAAGVPKEQWPNRPSDHVCLGRAVKAAAGRSDRVEPINAGWCLTITNHDKLDLEDLNNTGKDAHEVCVTAKVIKIGDTQELRITPSDSPHAGLIRHEYEAQRGLFLCAMDLSQWLTRTIIPWVGGVATRSRGGSYYVMKGVGLQRMLKVKTALDSVTLTTNKVFSFTGTVDTVTIPVVTHGSMVTIKPEFGSLDAIKILLNGLIEETDRVCKDLNDKLFDEKLGKRALQTQITRAAEMEERLSSYSEALGIDLSDINARLVELKGDLGVALLNQISDED